MKIPLYTILGPSFRANKYSIRNFCSHPLLGISSMYSGILGLLGVVQLLLCNAILLVYTFNISCHILSLFDMVMLIKCGPQLPPYMAKKRPYYGKIVSPEAERDLKLIALFISLEYYFLLIVGALTKYPLLFMPFLILYSFIVAMEFLNIILSIFNASLDFNRSGLFTSVFIIYNYLCVFCAFWKQLSGCDY